MPASSPEEYHASLTASYTTIPANPGRRGLVIGNTSDASMNVRIGDSNADANTGIPIPPGTAISFRGEFCPTDRITIYCAGAAKAVTAYEWAI